MQASEEVKNHRREKALVSKGILDAKRLRGVMYYKEHRSNARYWMRSFSEPIVRHIFETHQENACDVMKSLRLLKLGNTVESIGESNNEL